MIGNTFGYRNYYNEAVDDMLRQHFNIPKNGYFILFDITDEGSGIEEPVVL